MLTLLLIGCAAVPPAPKVFGRAGASGTARQRAEANSTRQGNATGASAKRGGVETEREPEG